MNLSFLRPYRTRQIGSSYYKRDPFDPPNDVDILVSVPEGKIPEFSELLVGIGFTRNTPSVFIDDLVHSSYSCGYLDIQIATPRNFDEKVRRLDEIVRGKLHIGKCKKEMYELYRRES